MPRRDLHGKLLISYHLSQRINNVVVHITEATEADLPVIQHIAQIAWPVAFGDILTPAQIDYMLEQMYSLPSLKRQIDEQGHVFLLASRAGQTEGYVSYELNYRGTDQTKIHKIYLLPTNKGSGMGRALMERVAEVAVAAGNRALTLNVNRYNQAVHFYEKMGFHIVGQEDIDIGEGFWMEDYVMEKGLS
jgi:diamine N-acetyltransferase